MKKHITKIFAACLIIFFGIFVYKQLFSQRQSGIRHIGISELWLIQYAFTVFQNDYGRHPIYLHELVEKNIWDGQFPKYYGFVNSDPPFVYRKTIFRAVKKGEPWGGVDEITEKDIPAGRAIWIIGEDPKIIDETEFQRKYKKRL